MASPMKTAELTERRKADRAAMTKLIAEIAASHGAAVDIASDQPNDVRIEIEHPAGLRCYVWLSGRSIQPDIHVIPWHLAVGCSRRLDPSFGDVNPYHFRKATHVAHGWSALAAEIERGLVAASNGSAFIKD